MASSIIISYSGGYEMTSSVIFYLRLENVPIHRPNHLLVGAKTKIVTITFSYAPIATPSCNPFSLHLYHMVALGLTFGWGQ